MTKSAISPEALRGAMQVASERVKELRAQLGEIQTALAEAEAEEQLLGELLAVRGGGTREHRSKTQSVGSTAAQDESVTDAAAVVLEEAGRPVHVSELMRILLERQVRIPGAGKQANLISHMSRDARIVRPSRGMYGLSAWGLEDMPRGPRKTRKRTTVTKGRR